MNDQRERFVRQLAEFLVGNQAMKSIALSLDKPEAVEWAALRNTTPLFGYLTVEEAAAKLDKWLASIFAADAAEGGE
jgi:hypothetical protein